MKNNAILILLSSMILVACGSDSNKTTTNNGLSGIPTHSSQEDCDSNHLNPTVTTDVGPVRIGIPGNRDCPYKKTIHHDLYVEAFVTRTRARDAFSIGYFGISGNVQCNLRNCWSYKHQCPPHFARVTNNNALFYGNFNAHLYTNYNRYDNYRYDSRSRYDDRYDRHRRYDDRYDRYDRRSRYDDRYDRLSNDRVWCRPIQGSRWYDEWLDRIGADYYL